MWTPPFFKNPLLNLGMVAIPKYKVETLFASTVLAPGPQAHTTLGAESLHDSSPSGREGNYVTGNKVALLLLQ